MGREEGVACHVWHLFPLFKMMVAIVIVTIATVAIVTVAMMCGLHESPSSIVYSPLLGHVDAGKSTLMGHLLFKLGQVSKRSMHR